MITALMLCPNLMTRLMLIARAIDLEAERTINPFRAYQIARELYEINILLDAGFIASGQVSP